VPFYVSAGLSLNNVSMGREFDGKCLFEFMKRERWCGVGSGWCCGIGKCVVQEEGAMLRAEHSTALLV
jgi:hypothetical protein